MSVVEPRDVNRTLPFFEEARERVRKHWWLFLLLGVALVLAGGAAVTYPLASSVGVVIVLGIVLSVSGVCTIIMAFWAGNWTAMILQLLVGILYVLAGAAIRDAPVESTALLTMFVAAFFIAVGAVRITVALVERFPQWGWALVNGIVTLLAGMIIYDSYPTSALWVIGLLVGLELLFNGWTWIMLSLVVRQLPKEES